MKALGDYVHSKGLKFGIYSDAGTGTCQNRPGSRGYEYQDALTYAEWGIDFLGRLNGDFAIAIWDRETREALLARDRFGVRPLFLAEYDGDVCFASEGKALLRHPSARRELDPVGIAGPFVAWNAPLLPAIVLVNYLIYRRLIPADRSFGSLDRRTVVRMAAGNYGGNLFALAGNLYLPVLVANLASASEAAYFYVPWLFSLSLQLVAINVMTSLTVEAAAGDPGLRTPWPANFRAPDPSGSSRALRGR
jgi:hypothetical protein